MFSIKEVSAELFLNVYSGAILLNLYKMIQQTCNRKFFSFFLYGHSLLFFFYL
jgi:hypothetical protein